MNGWIIFLLLLAALVGVLRWMRRREIRAFRETDDALLKELQLPRGADYNHQAAERAEQPSAPAVSVDVGSPGLSTLETDLRGLKPSFPDLDRGWLFEVDKVVRDSAYVFACVPFEALVEGAGDGVVPLLLVRKSDFQVLAGLHRDLSQKRVRELEQVFEVLNIPLVHFPPNELISSARIKLRLQSALRKGSTPP